MNTTTTAAAPSATGTRTGRVGRLARRWPTGLGVVGTVASLAILAPLPGPLQTWMCAWGALVAAVIYLTWGAARGDLGSWRWLAMQTAAVLAYGAVAVGAAAAEPTTARYVLAAAWLAHAAWDVGHHIADRVVPRWYAETCMVYDIIIAAALLTVGTI